MSTNLSNTILIALSVLPVILLMIFIYRKDKYQKEPIKLLAKAFIGGIIAISLDFVIIGIINRVWTSDTVFYTAFWEAGFPEELSKFLIFMILIWRKKDFDEYMDGIVYATFIGLGFACVENILYVLEASSESFRIGVGTGITRAFLSVPGHFLFGVMMGYFLSMAKFHPQQRAMNLLLALFLPAIAHGLFDWLLMASDALGPGIGSILYIAFLVGDIYLWKIGIRYIRKQQENSRLQAVEAQVADMEYQIGSSDTNYDSEYKRIDWHAGDKW